MAYLLLPVVGCLCRIRRHPTDKAVYTQAGSSVARTLTRCTLIGVPKAFLCCPTSSWSRRWSELCVTPRPSGRPRGSWSEPRCTTMTWSSSNTGACRSGLGRRRETSCSVWPACAWDTPPGVSDVSATTPSHWRNHWPRAPRPTRRTWTAGPSTGTTTSGASCTCGEAPAGPRVGKAPHQATMAEATRS